MTDWTTPENRAALGALADGATEGPWECWDSWKPHYTRDILMVHRIGPDAGGGVEVTQNADLRLNRADAELICAAREAVPQLLTEIERLQSEVAAHEAEVVLHDYEIKAGRGCAQADEHWKARAGAAEATLDVAAGIIDDARHALSPDRPGPRIEPAKRVLWSEAAHKIVLEWQDRKRVASCHLNPRPGMRRAMDGE